MTSHTPIDPNQFLKLALAANLPTAHVNTAELLHVREIIEFCNDKKPVVTLKEGIDGLETALANNPKGTVFITRDDTITPKVYLMLKGHGSTCVWVNTKLHPLHLVTGTMVAPIEMVRAEAALQRGPECATVEEMLPALGGLTLKDVFECSRLTRQRDGKITAKGLSNTRQGYPQKLKGISQISSTFDFYDVPTSLAEFVTQSLRFFHAEAPLNELAPRGILLDGPPGTGKTLGAKFLADHLSVPLYRLSIGDLKGKYVGESEGALAAALAQLDQAAPCVVLIDEVEKFFNTTESADSGVTSGLMGSLLWWLQEHSSRVLTIMTTNNVKRIPPELHREGRVDVTLQFNGLNGPAACKTFAEKCLAVLEKKFGDLTPEERSKLTLSVGEKLSNLSKEGAVPQVKVDELVKSAYKMALANRTAV